MDAHGCRDCPRDETKGEPLQSCDDAKDGNEQSVNVESGAKKNTGMRQKPKEKEKRWQCECDTGVQKQPSRRKEQAEGKMPPAVAECSEGRSSGSPVLPQMDRNFRDFHAQQSGSDHYVTRKIHSPGPVGSLREIFFS